MSVSIKIHEKLIKSKDLKKDINEIFKIRWRPKVKYETISTLNVVYFFRLISESTRQKR